MESKSKKVDELYVISNTHWDIEYLWSLKETQLLLVDMMDKLLNIFETNPEYQHFHMDSQVFPIEEYLKARPEKRDQVAKLVSSGKLLIGPWLSLPDEFLASGESLIRNLFIGHKKAKALGKVMKVGYNIFSFGQISQLPQIYKGFGIDFIIFKRGINEKVAPKTEFIWKSPDGTAAYASRIGLYGRSNFSIFVYIPSVVGWKYCDPKGWEDINGTIFNLCDIDSGHMVHQMSNWQLKLDPNKVKECIESFRDELKSKSTTNCLLSFDGFDQGHPYSLLTELIDQCNKQCDNIKVYHGSLEEYAKKVKPLFPKDLQVLEGEMRHISSGEYIFPGVLSARMPIKLMNEKAQTYLEKWAEPTAVFANIFGAEYPSLILQEAWEDIVINQHHDGVTGLHLDRIFLSSMERYRQSIDISETVTRRSLQYISTRIHIPDAKDNEVFLVVFNPLQYKRSEPIEIDVDFIWDNNVQSLSITDMNGNEVVCDKIFSNDVRLIVERYYWYPLDEKNKRRIRVVFEAKDIPAMGYKTFRVKPIQGDVRSNGSLCCGTNMMENEHLRVKINSNGTLDITEKATGITYVGMHYFVDDGEVGSGLSHVRPQNNQVISSLGFPCEIALCKDSELATTFKVVSKMKLPEEIRAEKIYYGEKTGSETTVFSRSEKRLDYDIISYITLKKGSKTVDIQTEFDNTVKDHRLRVCFPTNLEKASHSWAQGQFDVVKRPISSKKYVGPWPYEQFGDPNENVHPKELFVDVSDGEKGVAIISPGLPEYTITNDRERTIILTLLRAVKVCGNVKNSLNLVQPLAQCPGKHIFKYAIYPHQGTWEDVDVFKASTALVPMKVAQVRLPKGNLPIQKSFINITPSSVIVSALKKCEDRDSYALRLWNSSSNKAEVKITCDFNLKSSYILNLEENRVSELHIKNNEIVVTIKPKQILTLELEKEL